jgi:hypothetical protein
MEARGKVLVLHFYVLVTMGTVPMVFLLVIEVFAKTNSTHSILIEKCCFVI